MSVTIVSAPSKTVPAAAQDSAGGNAAGIEASAESRDFASMLFAQLIPQAVDASSAPAIPPVATGNPPDGSEDSAATAAEALFATLGLIPAEPVNRASAALNGTESVNTGPSPSLPSLRPSSDAQMVANEPALATPAATDNSAKFAAVALGPANTVNAEDAFARSLAVEAAPNNHSTQTTQSPVNTNNIPASRELSFSVPTPVRDQNWATDFGQKIVWLVNNDKQTAQLSLNPPQMGPIEISLNVDKGNATASFVSANADVRQAIETALPRLREMLASAGIELGQANVGSESFRQPESSRDGSREPSQRMADNAILDAGSPASISARAFAAHQGNGLVDIFA